MNCKEVNYRYLLERGFSVTVKDSNLAIAPFSKLTKEEIECIKKNKQNIMLEMSKGNIVTIYSKLINEFLTITPDEKTAISYKKNNPEKAVYSIKKLSKLYESHRKPEVLKAINNINKAFGIKTIQVKPASGQGKSNE